MMMTTILTTVAMNRIEFEHIFLGRNDDSFVVLVHFFGHEKKLFQNEVHSLFVRNIRAFSNVFIT